MTIEKLDHVNIRTANLKRMVAFYETVLGLRIGPRPDFNFPGAWLYAGDRSVVHLIEVESQPPAPGSPARLTLEHFAFSASGGAAGLDAFTKMLDERGLPYELAQVPDFGITQVNLCDPDGNHLHVDFSIAAAGP